MKRLKINRANSEADFSNAAIRDAVLSHNLHEVKKLVENGANIALERCRPDDKGNDRPIALAIEHNYLDIAEYLLKNGSNPDHMQYIGDSRYRYLLETLASENKLAMLELLIKYGANVTRTLEVAGQAYRLTKRECKHQLNDPLNFQDEEKRKKFLEIDSLADMHYKKVYKILFDYAIGCAFTKESFPYLKRINISEFCFIGVSIDGCPITKEKLSQLGCEGAENAIVSIDDLGTLEDNIRKDDLFKRLQNMVEKENGIYLQDGTVNLVPLCFAAKTGDLLSVKARVESGNKSQQEILEALNIAIKHGHKEITSLLKEYVDVNTKDEAGNTLLHLAVINHDLKEVERLILKGANINACNYQYQQPLNYALYSSSIEILKLLLNNDAEIWGDHIISVVENGNFGGLALVLEAIKDKNNTEIKDFINRALFLAITRSDSIELLKTFRNHGIDFDVQDFNGDTLLNKAINNLLVRSRDLVSFHIRNFDCYPDGKDRDECSKYMHVKNEVTNSFKLIQYLLGEGVSPLQVNHNGYSALSLLVMDDFHYLPPILCQDLFNELIEYGADLNVVDHKNRSLGILLEENYFHKGTMLEKKHNEVKKGKGNFEWMMKSLKEQEISNINKEISSLKTAYSAIQSILCVNVVCYKP